MNGQQQGTASGEGANSNASPSVKNLEAHYDHILQTYKFFLEWRSKMLAGYFAVLAALGWGFSWIHAKPELAAWQKFVPIAGILVTLFFWAIEYRNREQYRDCMNVGRRIEKDLGLNTNEKKPRGMFLEMKRRESWITQSGAVNFFSVRFLFS
jgi:hypothetical protein